MTEQEMLDKAVEQDMNDAACEWGCKNDPDHPMFVEREAKKQRAADEKARKRANFWSTVKHELMDFADEVLVPVLLTVVFPVTAFFGAMWLAGEFDEPTPVDDFHVEQPTAISTFIDPDGEEYFLDQSAMFSVDDPGDIRFYTNGKTYKLVDRDNDGVAELVEVK